MAIQYRVKWKRVDSRVKRVNYVSRKRAENRLLLLTSDEPWLAMGKSPDEFVCCDGYECGCSGMTIREESDRLRAAMPALEYARIECREVGPWTQPEPPQ